MTNKPYIEHYCRKSVDHNKKTLYGILLQMVSRSHVKKIKKQKSLTILLRNVSRTQQNEFHILNSTKENPLNLNNKNEKQKCSLLNSTKENQYIRTTATNPYTEYY